MFSTILFVIVVLIVIVFALAANKPDTFRIQRSTSINATTEQVFALLEDFHNWSEWSPWEKMDPGMKRTHSGATKGKGAIYEWDGNKKVGTGRMEIIDITPNTVLRIKLDFFAPFEAHNTAEFTLENGSGLVTLTWAMYGPASFPLKIMHLFMNMDQMVGKDFENGLANLKSLAEK